MLKYIFITLILVILTINLKGQIVCETECQGLWSESITTINSNLYPGCQIEVKYKKKECNGRVEFTIIYIQPKYPECNALLNDLIILSNGYIVGFDVQIARNIYKEMYSKLADLLFENAFAGLPPLMQGQFICPNGFLTVMGFKGACTAICARYKSAGPTETYEGDRWQLSEVECSTECCYIENKYCKVAGTLETVKTTTFSSDVQGTCSSLLPLAECGLDGDIYNFFEDCELDCGNQ